MKRNRYNSEVKPHSVRRGYAGGNGGHRDIQQCDSMTGLVWVPLTIE